jgi:hypothetical protein
MSSGETMGPPTAKQSENVLSPDLAELPLAQQDGGGFAASAWIVRK